MLREFQEKKINYHSLASDHSILSRTTSPSLSTTLSYCSLNILGSHWYSSHAILNTSLSLTSSLALSPQLYSYCSTSGFLLG